MISDYIDSFEKIINSSNFILVSEIKKQKINDFLCVIEAKLIFETGILDIVEVVKVTNNQFVKKKYKYNFRTHLNNLIFRYDNSTHYNELSTFPHHKHLSDKVVESKEPDILIILSEIKNLF